MDYADLEDLNKKYSGTYLRVFYDGMWNTLYIKRIVSNEGVDSIYVLGYNRDRKEVEISVMLEHISFEFPPIGVLNYKNTVVMTSKFPARQWKKAACTENYRVDSRISEILYSLLNTYTKNIPVSYFEYTTMDIDILFKNEYYTLEQAKANVDDKKNYACAITNEFYITPSYSTTGYTLWHLYQPVAELVGDEIIYTDTLLKQEVNDFLRNQHA